MLALATARTWMSQHGAVALVVSCLVLLPVSRSVELPVAVMALLGLWRVGASRGGLYAEPGQRLLLLLFLAFWLPMLLALPDAVEPGRSARTAFGQLRFYLAGVFVVAALATVDRQRRLTAVAAWVLVFWVVDALVEGAFGTSLLGVESKANRVTGVFGIHDPSLKLGVLLPVLSPMLFFHARRCWKPWTQFAAYLAVAAVVVLAGSRGGWVMFAVVSLGYLGWLWRDAGRFPTRPVVALLLIGAIGVGGLYAGSGAVRMKIDQTMHLFRGDAQSIDYALSSRLNLWKNAARMLADNPVNGVGPRGFRYAYRDYADPDDPFLGNTAATYAHQMLLELGSESGIPGLVGYLLAMALLLRSWWRASGPQRTAAVAWALALLGIFFPVNTHLATYSSFWGQVIWWLVALYVVAISTRGGPPVDRARN